MFLDNKHDQLNTICDLVTAFYQCWNCLLTSFCFSYNLVLTRLADKSQTCWSEVAGSGSDRQREDQSGNSRHAGGGWNQGASCRNMWVCLECKLLFDQTCWQVVKNVCCGDSDPTLSAILTTLALCSWDYCSCCCGLIYRKPGAWSRSKSSLLFRLGWGGAEGEILSVTLSNIHKYLRQFRLFLLVEIASHWGV